MSSGRPRVVLKMHFFVSCQIYVENKQLFLHFVETTLYQKWSSTVSYLSKGTRLSWDICSLDIIPVNGVKTFYIDIKTIECVKKQPMFPRRLADFQG